MATEVFNYQSSVEEYEVNSLSEYFSLIKKISQNNELIYRGENKKYPEINGSIFRENNYKNKNINISIYQEKILKEFYKEMAPSIKDLDRENFLAYSQHHGVPTALVDVTLSPLISLFFACSDEPDKDGFVYIFNKEETIDISEVLLENPYIDGGYLSSVKNESFIIYLMNQMHNEIYFPIEKLLKNLIAFINKDSITPIDDNIYSKTIRPFIQSIEIEETETREITAKWINLFEENIMFENGFHSFISNLKENLLFFDNKHWIHEFEPSTSKLLLSTLGILNGHEKHILWYFFILSELIFSYKHTNFEHSDDFNLNSIVINFLPILTYEAITDFNRIKAQNGEFIFQMALKLNINNHLLQRLNPAIQIKIDKAAKEAMMDDLDMMGINGKILFGDPDSISKYLKNKYTHEAYQRYVKDRINLSN